MPRSDISENLIHFTRDETEEKAFLRLEKILADGFLLGSNRLIRGGFNCVCFSEAPIENLESGLVNPDYYSSYSPFGIMVPKKWLFALGGRPVIYEPDSEFNSLPDSHKWRHMRYEPDLEPPIDFTWEREWRIHTDSLHFDHSIATIVVADEFWANRLIADYEWQQESNIYQYTHARILDEMHARLMFERSFSWDIVTLR